MTARTRTAGVLAALAGLFAGITGGSVIALFHDIPQLNALKQYRPPAQTRIYSSDNRLLARIFLHRRDPVPLEQIPSHLVQALLATEDRTFFSHSGLDIRGIVRALIRDILAGHFKEGASTLTQQLAKTLFLSPEKSVLRKLQEAVITVQIERRYTKEEILELYLNQIYLGSGAYGVEAAAWTYFGTPARDLTLSQSALIAGLPKAPSRYSPLNNPDLARKRRDTVLRQMHQAGFIPADVMEAALAEALPTHPGDPQARLAPWFVSHILPELEDTLGGDLLGTRGLTVLTTLDMDIQAAAEAALEEGLRQITLRMSRAGLKGPSPQAALVALDLETGGILAMVGGRSGDTDGYNRAVAARRQPGSAFKPLIYAAAVEQGLSQASLVLDAPLSFPGSPGALDWEPENYSGKYLGEITARKALALSKNTPAVRLAERLGTGPVTDFARRAGIASPLRADLTLALGTSEVSLLELTAAYGVFPNQGTWIEPFGLVRVTDPSGHVLHSATPLRRAAMSRVSAAIVTDMLRGVIAEGTGKRALALGGELGGKTGTTDGFRDALFIGFSTDTVMGVWVGLDRGGSLGRGETGSRAALPIWMDAMRMILKKRTGGFFDIPDGTLRAYMDPDTGETSLEPGKGKVRVLLAPGETLN
jgi:penicillin-binding protein 1A